MQIVSLYYILFIIVLSSIYYLIPKKNQWILLLIFSLFFYISNSSSGFIFIILTSLSVYFATININKLSIERDSKIKLCNGSIDKKEKKIIREKYNKKRKNLMIICILFNVTILCFFKYLNFGIGQINNILKVINYPGTLKLTSFIVPLGISFYTFQTIGYLVDVYWEKCNAELNYFKVLLFTSFFPQIIQGPISEFKKLSNELFKDHTISYENLIISIQRIIWGYYKKVVIADRLFFQVSNVLQNFSSMNRWEILAGMFMYVIELYADFSGYMDIMCGICQLLDIKLTENFNKPFYSKSIAEFWRRWHMSLGEWLKKYIYYPVVMSRWNRKLSKTINKKTGVSTQILSATTALIIVWFTTGIWHGASWGYIVWGLSNGLFIILELWLKNLYEYFNNKLRLNNYIFDSIRIIRTFLIVSFLEVLPEAGSLVSGLYLWKRLFVNDVIEPIQIFKIFPFEYSTIFSLLIGIFLIILNSVCSNKEESFGLKNLNIIFKYCIYVYMVIDILVFGDFFGFEEVGFMYAQF